MRSVLQFIIVFGILTCPVKIKSFRIFEVNGVVTILALENENVNMLCQKGMPMAYCGFIHPSGKRYSYMFPLDRRSPIVKCSWVAMDVVKYIFVEREVRFSGNSLNNGNCVVTIRATENDSGTWKCHIGQKSTGIELSQDIELRIVDKLAAVETNIRAVHGQTVTLACVTTIEKLPLKYCRFEPPKGFPFSIDSTVTAEEPILGKHYYPQNKSLNRGDCAVTINKVKYTDAGLWTCGAGLDDGHEYTDLIQLNVEGLYTMSTTATALITLGGVSIILIIVVFGAIYWNKRRALNTTPQEPDATEGQELELQPSAPSSCPSGPPRLPPTDATDESQSEQLLSPQ